MLKIIENLNNLNEILPSFYSSINSVLQNFRRFLFALILNFKIR